MVSLLSLVQQLWRYFTRPRNQPLFYRHTLKLTYGNASYTIEPNVQPWTILEVLGDATIEQTDPNRLLKMMRPLVVVEPGQYHDRVAYIVFNNATRMPGPTRYTIRTIVKNDSTVYTLTIYPVFNLYLYLYGLTYIFQLGNRIWIS